MYARTECVCQPAVSVLCYWKEVEHPNPHSMQPGNDIRAGTPITMRNMCSNEAVHKFYFSTGGDMEDVKRLKETVLT